MYFITTFKKILVGKQFYCDGYWWFKYSDMSGWSQERAKKKEEGTRAFGEEHFVGANSKEVTIS